MNMFLTPLISVIVPIYNVEEYLEDALTASSVKLISIWRLFLSMTVLPTVVGRFVMNMPCRTVAFASFISLTGD